MTDNLKDTISGLRAKAVSETLDDPKIKSAMEQLTKVVNTKFRKNYLDDGLLQTLVYAIEVCGFNKNKVFKKFGTADGITSARVKKLWYETVQKNPESIDAIRERQAFGLVAHSYKFKKDNPNKDYPDEWAVQCLIHKDRNLYYAAIDKAMVDAGVPIKFADPYDILPQEDHLDFIRKIAEED
jgi:hypothetical protein